MNISSVLSFFRLVCCFQPFSSTALYIEDVEIAGDIEIIGNDFLSQDAAKGSRQANVDSSFVSFVQTRARGDEIAGLFGLSPSTSQKKHSLPVTSVFHTTQEHVDFDAHSNYQAPVEGLVALYSLEDHEAAHFNVEETCIPIKKNRLMLFKGGDSVHRTVIRNAEKNAVKFIGPFSTRTLSAVGAVSFSPTEYPTSDPTEYPTLNPTASPTSSSTPSPTAIASAATTTISPTTSPTTKSGKTSKSEKTSKSGKTPKSGKKNQLF